MGKIIFIYFFCGIIAALFASPNVPLVVRVAGSLSFLSFIIPFSKNVPIIGNMMYYHVFQQDTRTTGERMAESFFGGFFGDIGSIINASVDNSHWTTHRSGLNNTILFLAFLFCFYTFSIGLTEFLFRFWGDIIVWLPKVMSQTTTTNSFYKRF